MDGPPTSTHNGSRRTRARTTSAATSAVVRDLGGVPVSLQADDAARSSEWGALLGGLSATTAPPQAALRFSATAPGVPDRPPDERRETVELWYDGDRLAARHEAGLTAVGDPSGGTVGGQADPLTVPFRHLFQVVATHLLAHRGRFLVHGAAVVDAGLAHLVLGATGAGKSTLAAAALRAGWGVMGDDLAVLRMTDAGVLVAGIARAQTVPADVADDVPLPASSLPDDARGRLGLGAGHLVAGWFPAATTIIVDHGTEAQPPVPIPGRQVYLALLHAFVISGDHPRLAGFTPVAAGLARLGGWLLRHHPDPGQRLRAAAAGLEHIRRPADDADPAQQPR